MCAIGKKRIIDDEISLIPWFPNEKEALQWYQDPDVCRQCDNIDFLYDAERLNDMYSYLNAHGECYYIRYNEKLVGDVTLQDNGEISIVICHEYQNRHIGRRCIREMCTLAKEKGLREVKAVIYDFNEQSRKMFSSAGFVQAENELFVFELNT